MKTMTFLIKLATVLVALILVLALVAPMGARAGDDNNGLPDWIASLEQRIVALEAVLLPVDLRLWNNGFSPWRGPRSRLS